jgi:chain length determinant protein tyrosine kinase EpsG
MNAVVADRNAKLAPIPGASAPPAAAPQQKLPARARGSASSIAAMSLELVAAHDPFCARTEALRELRSELILRWFVGDARTLAVLGAHAADDSAVVAANLAIVMAQLGEQTLLIDANLREPRQHELFGLRPTAGLSDLLLHRDLHDEALMPIPAVENLHVLCAGPAQANPQELVSRTAFIYLMKTLPERFRAVIIATPPALAYADAQVIAARARGCLLVTRRHETRLADVQRIKAQLEPSGAVLVGGVMRE